jgi:hypothetical protein
VKHLTPALGTPEEVLTYFFFLLAFFAVDAFFFAMLFASSLSGVGAEGTGAVFTIRKPEMLHSLSAFPLAAPGRSPALDGSGEPQTLEVV